MINKTVYMYLVDLSYEKHSKKYYLTLNFKKI